MIGIYKITNNVNGHCYIGQSRCIEKRWNNEKISSTNKNSAAYDYPLSRAFRKYGIQNFTFEIIKECSTDELNELEFYYIQQLKPEYNQTNGGDYLAHGKLSYTQVQEIQNILINDVEGQVKHNELAKQYNVSPDTIQAINAGRAWLNSNLTYPLHISKYDPRYKSTEQVCIDCGKIISKGCTRCVDCLTQYRNDNSKIYHTIDRDELKQLIRNMPFTMIAKQFKVTDNAIRKWCDRYNLPRTKTEIKKYSDEEWNNL